MGEGSDQEVGSGLGQAEGGDEGDNGGLGGDAEFLFGQSRQDGALHANHPADEHIGGYQQGDLTPVVGQAEGDWPLGGRERGEPVSDAHKMECPILTFHLARWKGPFALLIQPNGLGAELGPGGGGGGFF